MIDKIKGSIFGVIVGDALGVPVEAVPRETIALNPVKDMKGFGSFNLPPGSWSDDSSMTLCITETLIDGYDIDMIAASFLSWMYTARWTPYGKVFGTGRATATAMRSLWKEFAAEKSGNSDEASNGNGSLMRTIPLLWYVLNKDLDARYEIVKAVSSITHAHIRSVLSCFYYLEYARQLYLGLTPIEALKQTNNLFLKKTTQLKISLDELTHFSRLLMENDFDKIPAKDIKSSAYVIDTLEASIWCLMTTNTYKDAVLKAVNLGRDSDTTGAVTGGLAGIVYGLKGIPNVWINKLARIDVLEQLVNDFCKKYSKNKIK